MINFKIDHLDPLGQGVDKNQETNSVTFIPKTLPGEEGKAHIIHRKKGVQFASILNEQDITLRSEKRIMANCPHFDQCGSCHFQHTTYSDEIQFKTATLTFLLKKAAQKNSQVIGDLKPQIVPAPKRFQYRNRIQLHYDLITQKMGLFHFLSHQIVEVPHCLLPKKDIQELLQELYQNQNWLNLAKKNTPTNDSKGHVEIYLNPLKNNETIISWNQLYSSGGFSQVNEEMNALLLNELDQLYRHFNQLNPLGSVIDLFGGSGNLTHRFDRSKVYVVDAYIDQKYLRSHQEPIQLNLYGKNALLQLKKHLQKIQVQNISVLVLDPPRSGLKNLDQFVQELKPEHIFYVSCNPQTLFRDLTTLQPDYRLEKMVLLDFFPATYHFETLAYLRKNK